MVPRKGIGGRQSRDTNLQLPQEVSMAGGLYGVVSLVSTPAGGVCELILGVLTAKGKTLPPFSFLYRYETVHVN